VALTRSRLTDALLSAIFGVLIERVMWPLAERTLQLPSPAGPLPNAFELLAILGLALVGFGALRLLWPPSVHAAPPAAVQTRANYEGVDWEVVEPPDARTVKGPFCPTDAVPLHRSLLWLASWDLVTDTDHVGAFNRLFCPHCHRAYPIDARQWPGRTIGHLKMQLAERELHRRLSVRPS